MGPQACYHSHLVFLYGVRQGKVLSTFAFTYLYVHVFALGMKSCYSFHSRVERPSDIPSDATAFPRVQSTGAEAFKSISLPPHIRF